ncbi:MAG: ABC transporter ATP-binding protein [Deferribacteres bacterium]|nr:ABC transporter ATP-binding protein [candidate division KSB1 bacterium]MCB9500927.1 ABC transporter ATP-binding protein [Deferribacteres bacterium]
MARVRLQNVSKAFDTVQAVDNVSFEVKEGEFFSLLGPSGCGKTTTLRMLAGFETPSAGSIFFNDTNVTTAKPQHRNVGMVFQNYALFAHLSVGENVAFGLRARNVEKHEIASRVSRALAQVDLSGLENRAVSALSGGQQQRVALARALVVEPQILLLDEPLSNLDAKLRVETRERIRSIQKKLGITTFYVTHDQEEALTQSDRMAVFFNGKCEQIGTPREIFNQPVSREVMAFLGRANFFQANVVEPGLVRLPGDRQIKINNNEIKAGTQITLGIRPHHVELYAREPNFVGEVSKVTYTGAFEELVLRADELQIEAVVSFQNAGEKIQIGDTIPVKLPPEKLTIF